MKTRYLQRLGQSWYVRVKVPAVLQKRVGNTHIRRALGTRDLDEANRRKWAVVERIQAHLDGLRAGHVGLIPIPLGKESAPASASPPPALQVELPQVLRARPEPHGADLEALLHEWLLVADCIEQTKRQHRQAVLEFLGFMGMRLGVQDVTREVAATFVQEGIKGSTRSYCTKRRKLNSLIAFWRWLAERRLVRSADNPWTGFRLGKKAAKRVQGRRKRPYRDEELLQLFSGRPVFPGLAGVMVLALFTGARMEELCALAHRDVRRDGESGFILEITKSKTAAGIRSLVVLHPAACQVLASRWNETDAPDVRLFSELLPGGYDGKYSWGASKAFGRYRDRLGLSRETDFHSLRRTFVTLMENAGVDQVRIARYVGHDLPTLAFAVYSGGSSEQTMRATADAVKYPSEVEAAVAAFIDRNKARVERRGRKPRHV